MRESRPPLREALRAATRHRIADAALDLVEEAGIGGLRADAVAARAGVSRRTFFNYVAGTAAALAIPVEDYLAAAHRNFTARPAGEDIVASMIGAVREIETDIVDRLGRMLRLAAASGSVPGPGLETWDRYERVVQDAIAERLPTDTDSLLAATIAAAVMGAGHVATRAWAADAGAATEIADYIARALGYLASITDAAQDVAPEEHDLPGRSKMSRESRCD